MRAPRMTALQRMNRLKSGRIRFDALYSVDTDDANTFFDISFLSQHTPNPLKGLSIEMSASSVLWMRELAPADLTSSFSG